MASNGQLAGAIGVINGAAAQWEATTALTLAPHTPKGRGPALSRPWRAASGLVRRSRLYGVGAWLVINNEVAPGALVASAILLARALAPIEGLVSSVKAIRIAFGAYGRLKALPDDAKSCRT